jgi:nitrogenase iron protein NifH
MRGGFCREIYIVANGEAPSLLAANNMLKAVTRLAGEGYGIGVAGIVSNQRGVPNEEGIVENFARRVGVPVAAHIPQSATVRYAEAKGKTVLEAYPESDQTAVYRQLAQRMLANNAIYVPKPLAGMDEIIDSNVKHTSRSRYPTVNRGSG